MYYDYIFIYIYIYDYDVFKVFGLQEMAVFPIELEVHNLETTLRHMRTLNFSFHLALQLFHPTSKLNEWAGIDK